MTTTKRYQRACEAAARRGARFLDRTRPGWHKRVPITKLRMADSCNCVLGHLEGDYGEAVDEMLGGDCDRAGHLGFNKAAKAMINAKPATSDSWEDWDTLTAAWVAEIRARRAQNRASQ